MFSPSVKAFGQATPRTLTQYCFGVLCAVFLWIAACLHQHPIFAGATKGRAARLWLGSPPFQGYCKAARLWQGSPATTRPCKEQSRPCKNRTSDLKASHIQSSLTRLVKCPCGLSASQACHLELASFFYHQDATSGWWGAGVGWGEDEWGRGWRVWRGGDVMERMQSN